MVSVSPSSESLFSHPDRLLGQHLKDVAERSALICTESPISFLSIGISLDDLRRVSFLIGVCHDFGKATPYFQEYIKAIQDGKRPQKRRESQHGALSALFAYAVVRSRFSHLTSPIRDILPYIAYEVVRRHHGDLHNCTDDVVLLRDDGDIFARQIASLNYDQTIDAYNGLLDTEVIAGFFHGWRQELSEALRTSNRIFRRLRKSLDVRYAGLVLFCYSVLLSADKESASGLDVERRPKAVCGEDVDRHRSRNKFDRPENTMNKIRNEIYAEVIGQLECLDPAEHIFSLNLPTGTGKTLTGLSFALKLREKIGKETGFCPRIIYCLPYLSIIDQNSQVFGEVLGVDKPSLSSEVLLTHHHLTDVSYTTGDEEYDPEGSQFLIEGWNAEVIVTTFVQFFHMLFSSRNRAHRRYHRVVGSIVILDEVQTLPHRYWELIRQTLSMLAKDHMMYIILMTATQPNIFKVGEEIRELAPGREAYFQALDRLDLYVHHGQVEIDTFIRIVREDIAKHPENDYLIVMNTIASSQRVFRDLTHQQEDGATYVYLSTRVVPKERLARIMRIKDKNLNPGQQVIVSTQLIEAGVDIDVDVVYRDFAPLDSINQVAGRCNRNFGGKKGMMHLFEIVDDTGKPYYQYIYKGSEILIQKTKDVLEGKECITEAEFVMAIEEYYARVSDAKSDDLSKNLIEHLAALEFEDLDKGFHLIDSDYPKYSVFVAIDEEAERYWESFCRIKEIEERSERKKAFLRVKKNFFEYVIAVPSKFRNLVGYDEMTGIGYISLEEIHQGLLYDEEIGFSPVNENTGGGTLIL